MVDYGASFHITPSREWFSSYTASDYGYVKLTDVQHVPDINLNLISIGRLDDEGYNGSF